MLYVRCRYFSRGVFHSSLTARFPKESPNSPTTNSPQGNPAIHVLRLNMQFCQDMLSTHCHQEIERSDVIPAYQEVRMHLVILKDCLANFQSEFVHFLLSRLLFFVWF